ncbi:cytochrome P450 2C20-like [Rhinophrynus dorsalis]
MTLLHQWLSMPHGLTQDYGSGWTQQSKMRHLQEKDNPQSVFHIKTATNTIFDFLDVGTETISITLRFSLLILLKHPDVAERIRKEIDLVIGRNRPPCIEDRSNMAYTEAVIHEIQRFINITPLGFPHKVSQDINFRGFVLPKDITVYFMLGSALKDPKHFKYPDLFYPEHFLDENGKFCKNEAFMPFSSGKRMCPGEGLARLELFLFLTNILQNFTLRSLVDKEDLSITAETSWFGSVPHPYQLCFIPR